MDAGREGYQERGARCGKSCCQQPHAWSHHATGRQEYEPRGGGQRRGVYEAKGGQSIVEHQLREAGENRGQRLTPEVWRGSREVNEPLTPQQVATNAEVDDVPSDLSLVGARKPEKTKCRAYEHEE